MFKWLREKASNLFQGIREIFSNLRRFFGSFFERKMSQEEQKAIEKMKRYGLGRGIGRNKAKITKIQEHFLPDDIVKKAKRYIDNKNDIWNLAQAQDGITNVFLPEDLPIVLKNSSHPKNKLRGRKMRQALEICEQYNLDCLIIPKYRVYNGFIMEQRLPIPKNRNHIQWEIYAENHEAFKKAAKQLTIFLFRSNTNDLFSRKKHIFENYGAIGRYDNFPLYIDENGVGKVGLIDLEGFNVILQNRDLSRGEVIQRAKSAIAFFPYHLEEILTAIREIAPLIDDPAILSNLDTFAEEVQMVYKVSYQDYREFLMQNNIAPAHPNNMVSLTTQRKEYIKKAVIDFIYDQEYEYKDQLLEVFAGIRQAFEDAFSEIVDLTVAYPQDRLKSNLKNLMQNGEIISSYGELMTHRTLFFKRGEEARYELDNAILKKLGLNGLVSLHIIKALINIIKTEIYSEMVNAGEMSYYRNNAYGEYFQI